MTDRPAPSRSAPTSVPVTTPPKMVADGPPSPHAQHWLFLMIIVVIGGSSFSAIRMAVETAPPSVVAAGRLWVAALVLYVYMQATGRRMIPIRDGDGRFSRAWLAAIGIGLTGYAGPMILFPFAQQSVSSLLAGIYMAVMPIATVFLAALFADEPLTRRKLVGFFAGTAGVIILIGPEALGNILSDSVIAQLALVLATTGYAVASVIMRRAPSAPARSFSTLFMLIGAIAVTPFAIMSLLNQPEITAASWGAILYLGLMPTGATAILIINVIRGAGAGFMATGNYLTPVVAIALGIALFGETLVWRYALGLVVILTGLAITQPQTVRMMADRILRRNTA